MLPAGESIQGMTSVVVPCFNEEQRIGPTVERVVVFRALVRGLRLSSIRDTQCGFKLLRRATVVPILRRIEIEGFAFDVELLARAERAGLRVAEVPVDWNDAGGSKVRLFADAVRMA